MDKSKLAKLKKKLTNGESISEAEKSFLANLIDNSDKRYQEKNDDLLVAIAKISTILLKSPDLEESLHAIFKTIGEAIKVDRIYYFKNKVTESGSLITSQKIEWIRGEISPQIDNPELQNIPTENLEDFIEPLKDGDPFIAVINELPDGDLKTLLASQEIKSILVLPIFVNDKFYGFIGFDDCTIERKWEQDKVSILQTICSQMAINIEKKEVEELLEKTYRLAGIGTWEMDLNTEEFYWSPITKEILEVEQDVIPDYEQAMGIFKDEEAREMIRQDIDNTIKTGVPYSRELEIKTAKGNLKWVIDTGQADFEDGECVRIIGTLQDIDQRKRAEIESEKNKKLLDSITAQTDVAIWVRKYNGIHLFANNEWKRVFGLEGQNIVDKSIYDLVEEEIADKIMEYDRKVIDQGKQFLYEERVKTVEGYRYYMVNKFPITGIVGEECAVGGIGTDITDIKKTEKKLQFAEQRLREIIEHSTNLFFKHDTDLKLNYLSPQAEAFLGIEPMKGQYQWNDFLSDHPVNEVGMNLKKKAIQAGTPQTTYELQFKKKDGSLIWIEVNEAPIVKDGKTVSIVGSLTNITDRKLVQDEIKSSLKEKETLLIEIHHRVKNNLAVVASLIQFQSFATENEELQTELSQCVLRIKSMAAIHEQLYQSKNFSNLNFADNLKSLTENIISTLNFDVNVEANFQLEAVMLNVSQAITCSLIINEVITNSLKHAFKGRKSGKIDIECKQEQNYMTVRVTDNGIGLPSGFSLEKTQSVGVQLIRIMAVQLDAEYEYENAEVGTIFSIRFKLEE